jgi:hypothetical protein
VLVKTLDPGMAGIAHDATGLGERSTCNHIKESVNIVAMFHKASKEECYLPQRDTFDSFQQ